jgi:DNA (cytosine-5)-methyltransferase 1
MSVPQVDRDLMQTLGAKNPMAVAFDLAQITSKANRTRVEEGLPASTLNAAGQMHTAINIYGGNKRPDRPEGGFYVKEEATSQTLDSASGLNPSAAQGGTAVIAPSLTAFNMDSRSPQSEEQQRIVGAVYKAAMQVRRLTPRECERLQGFPDDYTLVQHRNKPAADGPRYKALGNSMAVPVMAWIGRRIAMVEQLKGDSLVFEKPGRK